MYFPNLDGGAILYGIGTQTPAQDVHFELMMANKFRKCFIIFRLLMGCNIPIGFQISFASTEGHMADVRKKTSAVVIRSKFPSVIFHELQLWCVVDEQISDFLAFLLNGLVKNRSKLFIVQPEELYK